MAEPTRRFGWIPDVPDVRDYHYAAAPEVLRSLGASVDLRPKFTFGVYDQGDLGSCTANAIAGAMEFDLKKENKKAFVPSRLFIYYNERVLEGSVDVDNGAQIRDGIHSVAHQGACPEKEWPYVVAQFRERPPDKCYRDAVKFEAVLYRRVSQELAQLKGCLAEGYPFVFGFATYQSLLDPKVSASGDIPLPVPGEPGTGPDGRPEGHAVLAVGYDDARHVFYIRNSWGKAWGDPTHPGYGTMPYSYLLESNLANDFWTIRIVSA